LALGAEYVSEDSEAEAADRSRRLSRRTLLFGGGGIGLAAAGFAIGTATGTIKLNPVLQHTVNALGQVSTPTSTVSSVQPASLVTTTVARVYSHSRRANLSLVTFLPADVAPAKLPVCLLLPGRPGDPRQTVSGLSEALSAEAVTGGRPFAVVALDGGQKGGQSCWHQQRSGADPMDVLIDELPAWLAAHHLGGLGGAPVHCAGIGLGAFDALLYARRRNERGNPVRAVAAISPTLATSWSQASTLRAFADATLWESLDPLRHIDALGRTAVGVWSGARDPYLAGIREFVKLAHPQVADIGRPGHASTSFHTVLAGVLRFLGKNLPTPFRG
jgi:pimeloyl-ACP methyl ester carboxylesterase